MTYRKAKKKKQKEEKMAKNNTWNLPNHFSGVSRDIFATRTKLNRAIAELIHTHVHITKKKKAFSKSTLGMEEGMREDE